MRVRATCDCDVVDACMSADCENRMLGWREAELPVHIGLVSELTMVAVDFVAIEGANDLFVVMLLVSAVGCLAVNRSKLFSGIPTGLSNEAC